MPVILTGMPNQVFEYVIFYWDVQSCFDSWSQGGPKIVKIAWGQQIFLVKWALPPSKKIGDVRLFMVIPRKTCVWVYLFYLWPLMALRST